MGDTSENTVTVICHLHYYLAIRVFFIADVRHFFLCFAFHFFRITVLLRDGCFLEAALVSPADFDLLDDATDDIFEHEA